jgi:hypothetical protein
MGWLSAVSALARLFDSLSGLYRDWRLRATGRKEARLSALEDAQRRSKRRVDIETEIASLSDDALRQRLRQYRRAGGGVRVGQADHPGRRRQANDSDDAGATRS